MTTVGIGYPDPTLPGGEGPASETENATPTAMLIGNAAGSVGLLGGDAKYDGRQIRATITAVGDDATSNWCKLSIDGNLDSDGRYDLLWLVLTSGDGEGTWYQINTMSQAETGIFDLALMEQSNFAGAVNDTIEIGRIQAYRDMAILRADGSAKYDAIRLDHKGSDGNENSSETNILKVVLFSQGKTPADDLSVVGTTQIDESTRNGVSRFRLGVDASPSVDPRGSRHQLRLVAYVRNSDIEVREARLYGKAWPK